MKPVLRGAGGVAAGLLRIERHVVMQSPAARNAAEVIGKPLNEREAQ